MYFLNESKRMTTTELRQAMYEQTVKENTIDNILDRGAKRNNELDNNNNSLNSYIESQHANNQKIINKNNFLNNVKKSLLSECLMKLYKESCTLPLNESETVIAKNLINSFITENGAQNLINSFSTKNLLLSEFSRICTKYYDIITESHDDDDDNSCESREFTIDNETRDDFYKELEGVDTEDASQLIKDRVSDSISDFIDTNMVNKLQYEEIIQAAQEKIDNTKNESYIEQFSNQAQRKINEMKLKEEKNVFNCMVESLCKRAVKDPALGKKYMYNNTFDMDSIIESTQLMYTMLEMVNTTNMININESFINNYIKSL